MTVLAWMVVAMGPVFEPGPVLPEDLAHPQGVEVSQIQRHLAHVEAALRGMAPVDATPEALRARLRALDALHDYWTAGEFPKNRDFADRRVPYFIDADGTACAVGHLMIASGDAAMAREIATYENNDFVAEIDHPGVGPWLARNGLTAEEAAWIQPQYGPCDSVAGAVCGADGNSYQCEALAAECGVDVASEGMCEGHEADDVVGGFDECPDSGEPASDDGSDKGCRVGEASPAATLLFLLALVRRRRSG